MNCKYYDGKIFFDSIVKEFVTTREVFDILQNKETQDTFIVDGTEYIRKDLVEK